jgi:manganese transport protein
VLAAAVFFKAGKTDVAALKDAYQLLPSFLGSSVAATLFAVALIAAGQSSTVTGTLAGQIVMEGYLRLRINPLLRRLLTRLLAIIPAVVTILVYGDGEIDALLVFSQVILSVQLGFAIIPLIYFVSDKQRMGQFAAKPIVQVLAWAVAAVLVFLNLQMVFGQSADFLGGAHSLLAKILVVTGLALLVLLLGVVICFPLVRKIRTAIDRTVHPDIKSLPEFTIPEFKRIAVALDFGLHDEKLVAFALGQGKPDSRYILLHIIESATTKMLGVNTRDLESEKDEEQLQGYARQLAAKGFSVTAVLGYNDRVDEIVRIVEEQEADLLVLGAHGHRGIKDFLYGETINKVRHELKIPVLVVNL